MGIQGGGNRTAATYMKEQILGILLAVVFFFGVLMFITYLEIYHFNDCLRVGHTKTYCTIDIFR